MSESETITPYQLLGGETALKSLVERFYYYMDTLPEAAGIRAMHAESLQGTKQKLFMYLSGWLGGPDLFVEQFGHPRLRMRHMPFSIGNDEKDQWMLCMDKAVREMPIDKPLQLKLLDVLQQLATHMINRAD